MTVDEMIQNGDIAEFREWCKTAPLKEITSAWIIATNRRVDAIALHAFKIMNERNK